ncbi:putative mitochondrial large ribosomal subunit L49 [Tricharina praecox]|uniref:putative mitochondrial large ribosomal subunit L49 n=1 Tax=Tricharina praecox TaxID=43433 RepID=UPI002220D200|nr:putative mitochondrial large ribosomal subunit L49 [Tricharina praecox]KAI5855347.1 putative mitochondrial large ribosomal subunit L49 [Tricharina praecox]
MFAVRTPTLRRLPVQLCRFNSTTAAPAAVEALETPPTPLPFFVHRSKTNNLPVYEEARSGGTLKTTRIRKTEGDLNDLRLRLIEHLELKPEGVYINNLTKHVIVKGHLKQKVEAFLKGLKF